MMNITHPSSRVGIALVVVVTAVLTGCASEYHGYDSGIDGVLWRQVAFFEDLLSAEVYDPLRETIGIAHTLVPDEYPAPVDDPLDYLAGIDAPQWDGSTDALPPLGLADGGAVLYDVTSVGTVAAFSIFIASGPRPRVATDDVFDDPATTEIYTCYRITVDFGSELPPTADRTVFKTCPSALVGRLADDAAFASAEVFDG